MMSEIWFKVLPVFWFGLGSNCRPWGSNGQKGRKKSPTNIERRSGCRWWARNSPWGKNSGSSNVKQLILNLIVVNCQLIHRTRNRPAWPITQIRIRNQSRPQKQRWSIFWKQLKNQNKKGSQGTHYARYRGIWSDEFPCFHKFRLKVQESKRTEEKGLLSYVFVGGASRSSSICPRGRVEVFFTNNMWI